MVKPKITIEGKEYEIKKLTGRDWRTLGEFLDAAPAYGDVDFLEKHASFIAEFYPGVDTDDVLNMPLEEIMPASFAVRNYITNQLAAKLEKVEKNGETVKAQ